MSKGILMVHYGSSYPETRAKSVDMVDKEVQEKYPDIPTYRSYTSESILSQPDDIRRSDKLWTVRESFDQIVEDGIEEVYVLMTFLLPVDQYYTTLHTIDEYKDSFKNIEYTHPALFNNLDCENVARALIDSMKFEKDKEYILVGHGTADITDMIFAELDRTFEQLGYDNVSMAVIKGRPKLEEAIAHLQIKRYSGEVVVAPYMVGAGQTTMENFSGSGSPYISKLSMAGFKSTAILKGVGEYPEFRQLFYRKLDAIMNKD